MKTNTSDRIVEYIRSNQHARPHDIVRYLGLSHAALHRQLRRLVDDGVLIKSGSPPLVFYQLQKNVPEETKIENIDPHLHRTIDEYFLFITPEGKLLYGMDGFEFWAKRYQSHKSINTLAKKYAQVTHKQSSKPWIDVTEKMHDAFDSPAVDKLLIADVYSFPIFGRTKLAKLVMHAKQSQHRRLMKSIAQTIRPIILSIIQTFSLEAVAFIPPTIPRPVQLMEELEASLSLPLPKLDIAKVIPGDVPVPQKSLSELSDRIINARSSIFPINPGENRFKRILLLDDVVGTGASFQETAIKLKVAGVGTTHIVAFAIVGNKKGYEVIRQL